MNLGRVKEHIPFCTPENEDNLKSINNCSKGNTFVVIIHYIFKDTISI